MADDVASVLAQTNSDNERKGLLANGFVIVGHSMGAKIGLASLAALHSRSDILEKLRGLVLLAPAPPTALVLPDEMREQQKGAYASEDSVRWTIENVLSNPKYLTDEDMRILVRDSLAGNPLAKAAWPGYGMAEDVSDSVRTVLGSLGGRVKTRVLVGTEDFVEPRERVEREVVRLFEECGVDVEVGVVQGVRHLVPLEDPGAVREAVLSL